MHGFILINQLQFVFQGCNLILVLSIQSGVCLTEVINNRNQQTTIYCSVQVRLIKVSAKWGSLEREIYDVNFGTGLSVRLIEGVRLIGGPLKRGFTVLLNSHSSHHGSLIFILFCFNFLVTWTNLARRHC